MAVVVVESPAKAKTINKYLGSDFTVLASYGHVRDLPPKDGSVDPDHDFEMKWEVASDSQKHIRAIAEALKDDDKLILATDPDREGEAISWHLLEALTKRKAIKKDTAVERVVFNAITKTAVTTAMENPRQIDMELVDAYLARRALDYLVGFRLSPVLWRKLPGAKSAGRVQSVALRLIVEREMEVEAFKAREYWSVKALLGTPRGDAFEARLVTLDGKKLDKFDLGTEAAATRAVAEIDARDLTVGSVESKPASRNPSAPFMTSTLQQEASRKFGFGARQTMNAAQRLYEAGHITYMRTDGIDMAPEAVMAARDVIKARYGEDYVPKSPRMYKNKAKNAQEAHECIRPTDMGASPEKLRLEADQAKLYDLVWKRSLASQMEAARFERTTIEVTSADTAVGLRASGQIVTFDGFLKVYMEGRDDEDFELVDDEDGGRLPRIVAGEPADKRRVTPEQHFTQPPPRYTEATLVKRMEELGIGRPSTYASIVSTIQERDYVYKDKNRLMPRDKGRLVTAFLESYFGKYLDYNFTADLEEDLDKVTTGEEDWKALLARFWTDFSAALGETAELRITDVLEKINEVLEPHLFPVTPEDPEPRRCKACGVGRLSLRTARSGGAFIGCSNYPECRYTRPLAGEVEGGDAAGPDGKLLGYDDAGTPVSLRVGPYGLYVQLGEVTEETPKPKRASIPKGMDPSAVDLQRALDMLALPRLIGLHPDDGEKVEASIGRFGPYVKHGKIYANIKDPEEVLTIGMNRAMEVLAQKAARGGGRAAVKPLRVLGEHPEGGEIALYEGRYGPYVKWEKVNATVPKETAPEAVTLEQALELIAAKRPAKKTAAKKAPAKKTAAKKAPAKKAATKKAAPKAAAKKTAPGE
ncbi:MAG: type I DNA topoisomerase [Rhodovulum sulfidophilum]|uniref:DNA topoisomerase 1 n=1 Tax=Rhodovulum sulfidophilum TaxID=35806 RepID=A0A2W5QBP3_RHOSU|nr:MAG: type I DNA topoisomerase [Rhodovulum sulfidophilum]